jgi:hypothetical protein
MSKEKEGKEKNKKKVPVKNFKEKRAAKAAKRADKNNLRILLSGLIFLSA